MSIAQSVLPAAEERPVRRGLFARLLRRPSAVAGLALLGAILAMAALADVVYPADPLDMAGTPFLWPGADPDFPLGTDMMGRDIAAGVFHGARVSLLIGGVATLVSLVIGVGVGAIAGFFRGRADHALMHVTELFQTIPPFLFPIVIVAILQPTMTTVVLAIGLTSWPSLARLVRAEVLRLRDGEMVQASIVLGLSDARIILTHVLPNVLAPIVVSASIMVASAILTESSLAFLGLGDPNIVSWGSMVGAGREVLRTDWYVATVPGLAIVAAVLALNLLGDGLNDALDPRQNRR
ncbi:ABC transporter permease subunit [Azospirillum melinis]|uniref:ABC transporter permease subunit n=1 Tax=Azospirillum melinis TaxID=328839 RepID=A0ABX2K9Q9_9PROT|nr:ABC transporter permease [Azospirillum melinis]MBP2305911.1 peptide/nickel transport system permease protein [Azospirillum melinis]NUA99201.1 ABC transporter permease subunit [Azospirillum melinis]